MILERKGLEGSPPVDVTVRQETNFGAARVGAGLATEAAAGVSVATGTQDRSSVRRGEFRAAARVGAAPDLRQKMVLCTVCVAQPASETGKGNSKGVETGTRR